MATDETSIIADGDEQHGALGEAVGGTPAQRRGQQHGDAEGQAHAAEAGVAAGEVRPASRERRPGPSPRRSPAAELTEQPPVTRRLQTSRTATAAPQVRPDRVGRSGRSVRSPWAGRAAICGDEVREAGFDRPGRVGDLPRVHELRRADGGRHPWTLDEEASRPVHPQALEAGINFFDTANVYSDGTSEEIVGRALADFAARDEVVLATKVHGRMRRGAQRRRPVAQGDPAEIDASLRRLGTDYVDLYQIHRWDHHTPIEETLEALHDVVKAGKARYIGASSMYAWQFAKAQHVAERHGWTRFVSMQNHYNLLYREEEREMLPLCGDQGRRRHPVEPAGARPPDAAVGIDDGAQRDRRVRPDAVPGGTARSSRPRSASPTSAASSRAQVALAWVPPARRSSRRSSVRRSRTTSTTPWPRSSSS